MLDEHSYFKLGNILSHLISFQHSLIIQLMTRAIGYY